MTPLEDVESPPLTFSDLDPRYAQTADAETITGLWLFDRDPAAPFAVSAGSGKVTNLDADMLDGRDESEFALADKSRPSPWVAETDVPVLTDAKYPNALLLDGSRDSTGLQSFTAGIKTDTIAEVTLNAGVDVDGVLLKDSIVEVDNKINFKSGGVEKYCLHAGTNELLLTGYGGHPAAFKSLRLDKMIGTYFIGRTTTFYVDTHPSIGSTVRLRAYDGSAHVDLIAGWSGASPHVDLPRAGDITGLAGKVFTWNGTVGADLDMNLNFLLKMPLKHICHFTMTQGVTDIMIETIPAGEFTQDMHISKLIAALDQAPGAGKSVAVTITDGTNTMTVTISNTDTTGSTTTGAFDWDASATSLTLKYSQTAGGSATKATVVCVHHYIATA